jgi:uncharacterized membrane protein YgdD (TMEM256/DUF423 family)
MAFLAVGLGAFGAHGLKSMAKNWASGASDYSIEQRLAAWQTASSYHLAHALAILTIGVLATAVPARTRGLSFACWMFGVGIFVFSGSLYALGLTGMRWLGALTPLGGLTFLGGWVVLFASARGGMKEA